jgi:hypothetical protein
MIPIGLTSTLSVLADDPVQNVPASPGVPGQGGTGAEMLKNIHPDFQFFPFMPKLLNFISGTQGLALVLCVGLLIVAALAWGATKAIGSSDGQRRSALTICHVVIVAALIGTAGSIIFWAVSALTS